MLNSSVMLTDVPEFKLSSTIASLVEKTFEYEIFHFPISFKGKYLGTCPLDMILSEDASQNSREIKEFQVDFSFFSLKENGYILNAIFQMAERRVDAAAVLNEEGFLVGILREKDILQYLARCHSNKAEGLYITLNINTIDYNLQEISRIVESNNAKILSLHFEPEDAKSSLLLTLKISTVNLAHVLATFERFGYSYLTHEAIPVQDDFYQDRYKLLMKYLDI